MIMNYNFNSITYVQILVLSLANKTVFNFVHTVKFENNFVRIHETG